MFIGRKNELHLLNQTYQSDKFEMLILYGRRRIGKTTLISEFYKNKKGIFYFAQERNDPLNLANFCEKVYKFYGISANYPKFPDWNAAFEFLAEKAKEEKLLLIIDEFPYLAEENKSLMSILQHAIDHYFSKTKAFIILCGSYVSFMEKEVMGQKSPLYGRRTAQIHLKAFNYIESTKFYDKYDSIDKLVAFGIFGGIPQYLTLIDDNQSIIENINHLIFNPNSLMFNEPEMLLKSEVREVAVYNSIIEAIAGGSSKLNQIASAIQEDTAKCAKYINALENLQLVKKEVPWGEKLSSRKTIYSINDNFFRFWYRFVFPNKDMISMIDPVNAYELIVKNQLDTFMGIAFEEICKQYLIEMIRSGKLEFIPKPIGKWWGNNKIEKRQEEIDLLAGNHVFTLYGECKWRNAHLDPSILQDLERKSQNIIFGEKKRFYLFSKSGFHPSLCQLAENREDVNLVGIEDLF